MKREIITTDDGSTTIHLPEWNEQYHSKHGAMQEAYHVFIKTGLSYLIEKEKYPAIHILEIGFGTGLNAFITLLEAEEKQLKVNYKGIEAYPVKKEELEKLNYAAQFKEEKAAEYFAKIHQVAWENSEQISTYFNLTKEEKFFKDLDEKESIHLIYFDAFGARVQPELWEQPIFELMYKALKKDGVLVTYSAKGSARRAMQACGFLVERLPGPPGKREMLRATKT
ncbi:tRNA (5-methylaminomethyl-2-thiouridine)(34)-methyltransferase MnmD [Mesonia aestuariivivens]|uniref:tRNA (5-methylaminomethyl-2-thiouridine)(34)-methyltransferase MnmD n=1 Tax=Mesonia aestuariivivens TaxID=2796128 RepID=A0ABS6W3X7_9FLAO|nr:tRNA (5-methylaminomethyl-2-thiouridine)(34)-methyltransferase MnmD [Mesonia aestuariivivens]MBW2962573.1 tRNA (5-methylaminomethyl-2-thiouridine)(34)-methyltransferase MnmD [Mesonia aestuariivivens]